MSTLLDRLNGGPRTSHADDACAGLWLAGLAAILLGTVALALHLLVAVPPGAAIVVCGLLGLVGFAGALAFEWRRDQGDGDDDGDDPPGPDGPGPEDDPVDWEPFERLLRGAADSREPVAA